MSRRHPDSFDRLRSTATLSGEAFDKWRSANMVVVGAGLLGGHVVREAARSGARCEVYDPGIGEVANTGTQDVEPGIPKVDTLAQRCSEFAPGSVRAHAIDVLHVGEGRFESADIIVDCSDDPGLSYWLTRLSNGWGIPMVRAAVDGSGTREMGRVLVSHGAGSNCACAICGASWVQAFDAGPRTPCLGARAESPPTYAGSATGMAVAALALLCAQRLVGGQGADRTLNREFIVDLDQGVIHSMRLVRTPDCLTGHRRWAPIRLNRAAGEITVLELAGLAVEALHRCHPQAAVPPNLDTVRIGLPSHPLRPSLMCQACGETDLDVGTALRAIPCSRCGEPMQRRRDIAFETLTLGDAEALSITDRSCASLGFPDTGALVRADAPGTPAIHLLLA